MRGAFKSRLQADGSHAQIGDVFHILAENFFIQAYHGAVFKQIFGPFFFLQSSGFKQIKTLLLQFGGDFGHFRVVHTAAHQIEHVLGAGEVQRFVAGDQLDDFGIAFHQFALGKGKRAGKRHIKADGFEHVDTHQAKIKLFLQLAQMDVHDFAVYFVAPFTQKVVILGVFNQIIVIAGDVFGAGDDVIVADNIVKHERRIVHNIADDVGVGARVDGFGKRPSLHPGFQLGNRHQRQQAHIGAAALNRIEQGLVFQVADKNVFFMVGQILVIDAVARHVDFFRPPEKRQLLFNQLFENFVFLLVVTRYIHRLAEKHRLQKSVVFGFAEGAVRHH